MWNICFFTLIGESTGDRSISIAKYQQLRAFVFSLLLAWKWCWKNSRTIGVLRCRGDHLMSSPRDVQSKLFGRTLSHSDQSIFISRSDKTSYVQCRSYGNQVSNLLIAFQSQCYFPDSKVHGADMEPTWVLPAPDGPHVGPVKHAISVIH